MRNPILFAVIRSARLCALLSAPIAIATVQGCTDLSESPTSAITPENFYRNSDEVLGGVASVYASMRNAAGGYYNISQVTSDENIVPTRGGDWYDNGKWIEMHKQTWTANSALGLDDISNMYNDLFAGVARANVVLGALENVSVPNQAQITAELRVLRAFYYYLLQDMFGGVPIVENTEVKAREQNTRAEVFSFIESELTAARPDLPETRPATEWGRVTTGAVDALLASLYLNAEVFTGTVTTTGLTKGTAHWQDAITAADRVLNSPAYHLEPNWRTNFAPGNKSSAENIFVVRFVAQDNLGLTIPMTYTHYNSFPGGGWNGFATIAETYERFDAADDRRKVFLIGPQVDLLSGQPITDRAGNPLVFSLTIGDITQASEAEGARIAKFRPDPARVGGNSGEDYPVFRLAEMYLIKAEALNELGQTAAAVALVNTVRARAPAPALNPANFTQASFRTQILNERLFELVGEGKRRQDQIRLGDFNRPWLFKNQSEGFRILMPIPRAQLDINPLLKQNPGY